MNFRLFGVSSILGFDRFLRKSSVKDVWLNLIGDGSHLNYLQERVKIDKIENVKFWGKMKSSDMPFFFDKADVLIISLEDTPVFNLTIPAKFQSYLNAEKPVFGVIRGEVADLITKYNLGWVSPPNNIEEIANTILEIVSTTPEILFEKTQNSNNLLKGQFNRETIIQKFTDIVFG